MRSRNLQENLNRKAAARPGGGDADAIDKWQMSGANVGNFGGLTKNFRSNCKKFLLIKKLFLPLHQKQGRPDSRNIKKRKKMNAIQIAEAKLNAKIIGLKARFNADVKAWQNDAKAGIYDKWYRHHRDDDGAAYDAGWISARNENENIQIIEG